YFSPLSPMTVDVGVYDRNVSETGTGWVSDGGNKSDFSLNAKYGAGDQLQGQLQYTYRVGNQTIKLKSSSLQFLVLLTNVAELGSVTVLRGAATLDGVPGYAFELRADDNGSADTLALSIWSPDGSVQ